MNKNELRCVRIYFKESGIGIYESSNGDLYFKEMTLEECEEGFHGEYISDLQSIDILSKIEQKFIRESIIEMREEEQAEEEMLRRELEWD